MGQVGRGGAEQKAGYTLHRSLLKGQVLDLCAEENCERQGLLDLWAPERSLDFILLIKNRMAELMLSNQIGWQKLSAA